MSWESKKIRDTFLQFFESKQHKVVPSAPMVIKNDPTLMFTNAGMNQFKEYFLGNQTPESKRATDTQKCLRVSGKHNDLEEVGVDTYHHTMFEMLGNWSFGDYFKKEAIDWAWELLTKVYKIDTSRLYVTIFEGDESDNLGLDQEAFDYWKHWIDEDRIIPAGKKDNFWEMGETGPCGPCSEIHVDIRPDEERAKVDGKSLVNEDHPQVIEVWNLVFMQYNRMKSGELINLPNNHVDTGMGFERLCMVLQGVTSNYDTDVFSPYIKKLESISGMRYKASDSKEDVAFRVIADHVRAIAFSIADGQLPSNTGAGYVIRRILRRAIRYGYSFLDQKSAFIYELVPIMVKQMGYQFTELEAQADLIAKVIKEEELGFLKTLEKGIAKFNEYQSHHAQIKGDFAFELYDTYGFPIDLTRLLAVENGKMVDIKGFEENLQAQKERSRKATALETGDWVILTEDDEEEFVGYDHLEAEVYITKYREIESKGKKHYQLVFNITPFYPEGGGQVGDRGYIEHGEDRVAIKNTKKENSLIVHFVDKLPRNVEAKFKAVVGESARLSSARNHSATHLLHEALREVLGTHVEQKGSLVSPDYLRFDFSHFQKVTDEELAQIETMVNDKVRANIALQEFRKLPIDEAKSMGAMALFGEKYGDVVRVIQFGDSVELCGGTHVKATGEIGLFKLTSEGAVAAGIRRVEAITGVAAQKFVDDQANLVKDIQVLLKGQKNITKAIQDLMNQNQKLNQQIESYKAKEEAQLKIELTQKVQEINGVSFIGAKVDVDAGAVKNLAFQLKAEVSNLFGVIVSSSPKPTITIVINDDLAKAKELHAGNMVRELAKLIKGGGGGQPFFATAGGKDPNGLDQVLVEAKKYIE